MTRVDFLLGWFDRENFSRGCEDRSEPSPSRRSASETEFGSGICVLTSISNRARKILFSGYFRLSGFYCLEQYKPIWGFTLILSRHSAESALQKKKNRERRTGSLSQIGSQPKQPKHSRSIGSNPADGPEPRRTPTGILLAVSVAESAPPSFAASRAALKSPAVARLNFSSAGPPRFVRMVRRPTQICFGRVLLPFGEALSFLCCFVSRVLVVVFFGRFGDFTVYFRIFCFSDPFG